MDKEQARFILRSFRPDGADVENADFSEALKLALENRELGEWLASERALDAAFAQALSLLDLPPNLRAQIFAGLASSRADFPQPENATDAALIGMLAMIRVPRGLRDEVLTAMSSTASKSPVNSNLPTFWRQLLPWAAAAGIALAFWVTRSGSTAATGASARLAPPLGPIEVVQAGFIRTFEAPSFRLDKQRDDPQMLVEHLKRHQLPCPGCLPCGLKNIQGIGCRELVIDGKRGSLICFEVGDQGIIHLLIFRREDVSGEFPAKDQPQFDQNGCWASARWEDGTNVMLVMSHTEISKLAALF